MTTEILVHIKFHQNQLCSLEKNHLRTMRQRDIKIMAPQLWESFMHFMHKTHSNKE
jgi:hypothetical protein